MKDWSSSASRPHICLPGLNTLYFGNTLETGVGGMEGARTRILQEEDREGVGSYNLDYYTSTIEYFGGADVPQVIEELQGVRKGQDLVLEAEEQRRVHLCLGQEMNKGHYQW